MTGPSRHVMEVANRVLKSRRRERKLRSVVCKCIFFSSRRNDYVKRWDILSQAVPLRCVKMGVPASGEGGQPSLLVVLQKMSRRVLSCLCSGVRGAISFVL